MLALESCLQDLANGDLPGSLAPKSRSRRDQESMVGPFLPFSRTSVQDILGKSGSLRVMTEGRERYIVWNQSISEQEQHPFKELAHPESLGPSETVCSSCLVSTH